VGVPGQAWERRRRCSPTRRRFPPWVPLLYCVTDPLRLLWRIALRDQRLKVPAKSMLWRGCGSAGKAAQTRRVWIEHFSRGFNPSFGKAAVTGPTADTRGTRPATRRVRESAAAAKVK